MDEQKTIQFRTPDLGAVVLSGMVHALDAHTSVECVIDRDATHDTDLSKTILTQAQKVTRGRIGVFIDHTDTTAYEFLQEWDAENTDIRIYPTQILTHMAHEGWADTVEFRRIARKYLRHARNHQRDTVVFLNPIFHEYKTAKIIRHLLRNQIQWVDYQPVINYVLKIVSSEQNAPPNSGPISIKTDQDTEWIRKRAEQILKRKLKPEIVSLLIS